MDYFDKSSFDHMHDSVESRISRVPSVILLCAGLIAIVASFVYASKTGDTQALSISAHVCTYVGLVAVVFWIVMTFRAKVQKDADAVSAAAVNCVLSTLLSIAGGVSLVLLYYGDLFTEGVK